MALLPRPRRTEPGARRYGPALSLGTNLTAGMLLFTFIGHAVDRRLGEGETFTLVGLFLGLTYGGYEVWKVVRDLQRPDAPGGREPDDEADA